MRQTQDPPILPKSTNASSSVTVGILALQGAFAEHQIALERLSFPIKIVVVLVRTVDELELCDALIIPGGESTTIAFLAYLSGLLDPLRKFLQKKPVWGTCAGAILLAQAVVGAKKGGQELLGGMSITMARNAWGSQRESFEADISVDVLRNPEQPFTGIFIRAPVIVDLMTTEGYPPVQVIARLPSHFQPHTTEEKGDAGNQDRGDTKTIVALRQGRHLLTTFHPELTKDNRFHEYFIRDCVYSGLQVR